MESLRTTMIFMVLSSAVLAGTFFYVWAYFIRQRYVRYWGLAWTAAIPHILLELQGLSSEPAPIVQALSQSLLVLTAVLKVAGCYAFNFVYRRDPPRRMLLATLPFLAWSLLSPWFIENKAYVYMPSSALLGFSYLWAGVVFTRLSQRREARGTRLVALLFTIAGLHEFDYPFLGHLPWFSTVGYMLASILAVANSFCLLIVMLEEARAEADGERARLHGLLETLPVGVLVTSPDGEVTMSNDAARELLAARLDKGRTSIAELEAQLFCPSGDHDPRADEEYPISQVLRTDQAPSPRELTIRAADGSVRMALVNAGPVHDERGRRLGAVAVFQDIGDLKAMQEEVARGDRLKGLGTLAAGVAHDFNNALTMIVGHAELAAEMAGDHPIREHIDIVSQVAGDSVALIKRIQDVARTRVTRDRVNVNLAEVVREVIDVSRPRWRDQAQAAGIRFEIHTDLPEDLSIAGEPPELREALLNLTFNAIDAMPGGGQLSFQLRRDGEQAVLRVRDTGNGIPKEVLDRVFDPFFTTKGERGTGLGLSVVFSIVQRHGGRIAVDSEPGRGTRFTMTFPLTTFDTESDHEVKVIASGPRSLRILAVDDERLVRRLTETLLTRAGHVTTTAADGEEALAILARGEDFDVVLTDLGMPGMNGWQLASAIRERQPELPIILVTGWGDSVTEEQADEVGIASVLPKPFNRKQLATCLEQVMAIPTRVA